MLYPTLLLGSSSEGVHPDPHTACHLFWEFAAPPLGHTNTDPPNRYFFTCFHLSNSDAGTLTFAVRGTCMVHHCCVIKHHHIGDWGQGLRIGLGKQCRLIIPATHPVQNGCPETPETSYTPSGAGRPGLSSIFGSYGCPGSLTVAWPPISRADWKLGGSVRGHCMVCTVCRC